MPCPCSITDVVRFVGARNTVTAQHNNPISGQLRNKVANVLTFVLLSNFRVMGFVNKIISRLDSEEKYGPMMMELGIRHVSYGAKPQYVDVSSLRLSKS